MDKSTPVAKKHENVQSTEGELSQGKKKKNPENVESTKGEPPKPQTFEEFKKELLARPFPKLTNIFEYPSIKMENPEATIAQNKRVMKKALDTLRQGLKDKKNLASRAKPDCQSNIDKAVTADMGPGQELLEESGKNKKNERGLEEGK